MAVQGVDFLPHCQSVMAPIRRYLRISKYSVLEVRIYLDNPADAQRWLLKQSDPVLPRVIEAVRPLVLPKLREENERAKKGGKKKGVKDVVERGKVLELLSFRCVYLVIDDFEVSIFLTELSTSHDVLTRHKVFESRKITDGFGTKLAPVDVEEGEHSNANLDGIPAAPDAALSVSDGSEIDALEGAAPYSAGPDDEDDKKKMGMSTTYEGFRIYGRILCLVVKRKGSKGKEGVGQAMLEEWISSTQAGEGRLSDD